MKSGPIIRTRPLPQVNHHQGFNINHCTPFISRHAQQIKSKHTNKQLNNNYPALCIKQRTGRQLLRSLLAFALIVVILTSQIPELLNYHVYIFPLIQIPSLLFFLCVICEFNVLPPCKAHSLPPICADNLSFCGSGLTDHPRSSTSICSSFIPRAPPVTVFFFFFCPS